MSKSYDYFSCDPDEEILSERSIDDAVWQHLDAAEVSIWPTTLPVYGWRRKAYEFDAGLILERALEDADEEHGNPDEATEPTPAMIAAARAFAEVMDREYQVWACERDKDPVETVNVAEWVTRERPDWLYNPSTAEWVKKNGGAK